MMFEYNIIWKGEIVDTADTKKEALFLKKEYSLAFHSSNITIKRVRKT
tara:strand:+ start:387 stop:530 length:144 start_codon:yes stop_codon:yes gene_type:complete